MNKKIFLDTNLLLSQKDVLDAFENYDLYICGTVLKELDSKKSEPGKVGYLARRSLKTIEKYLKGHDFIAIGQGVPRKNGGKLFIFDPSTEGFENNDDKIIQVTKDNGGYICSNDGMVRIKSMIKGMTPIEFKVPKKDNRVVSFVDDLFTDLLAMDPGEEYVINNRFGFFKNEYFLATDFEGSVNIPCQYLECEGVCKIVKIDTDIIHEQISPRNDRQLFLMDSVINSPVTIALGPAGTGKTICSLASAISLMNELNKSKKPSGKKIKNIVLCKPISYVGKELGFLPGGLSEKIDPHFASFYDALDHICPEYRDYMIDPEDSTNKSKNFQISILPLTFIRGRTFSESIIILDEAQNCSRHEIKTFLSRVGFNSKVIILGDIEQIDSKGLNSENNGLSILLDAVIGDKLVSVVYLDKQERSEIAGLASKI